MDVPTGWVQVLRGPRLPSQKWPSVPRPGQQRQSQVPRSGGPVPQRQNQVPCSGGHVQSSRVQPTRVNPDASRELACATIAKLGKALEVMGVQGACCRENQGFGQATSDQRRGRRMSEVHSEVRETHPRVGCGTRRQGSCTQRSEGSSPTIGGRASTAARSQCAPSPERSSRLASRDGGIEGTTRPLRAGTRRSCPRRHKEEARKWAGPPPQQA